MIQTSELKECGLEPLALFLKRWEPPKEPEKKAKLYFLLKCKRIVYIGHTTDVDMRMKNHISEGEKDWDECLFMELNTNDATNIEKALIRRFKPIYNKTRYDGISVGRLVKSDSLLLKQINMC